VNLCFVIQRYGLESPGGAETHCRWLATRLSRRHRVEVVTTCARDYTDWRNHHPPGPSEVEGIRVTRFPVSRPRSERVFALYSDIVFRDHHTAADEEEWVDQNGPFAPALVAALPAMSHVDLFLFYSYRYYTTFRGLPVVAPRAVLVPTAEDDRAIRLPVFRRVFQAARGLIYLTPEEQALVESAGSNRDVPSVVVGSGVNLSPGWREVDVRERFGLPEPYVVYVGRIDRNKGVDRLMEYYKVLAQEWPAAPLLVLAGAPTIAIAEHPKVRHLGVVSETEKHALIAGATALVMPSAYESLSLSVLEAWALGRPVLVNAECRVLEGQCVRSNGGLFYRGYAEFAPALRMLAERADLQQGLGEAGRAYVAREYDWDIVERRTDSFLEQIAGTPTA
jgi:glycosyltransferase involved in cell wall biosynthesis